MNVPVLSEEKLKTTAKAYRNSNAFLSRTKKLKLSTINNLLATSLGYKGSYGNLIAACRASNFTVYPGNIDYAELARKMSVHGMTPVNYLEQSNLYIQLLNDAEIVGQVVRKIMVHGAISAIYRLIREDEELQYSIMYGLKHNIPGGKDAIDTIFTPNDKDEFPISTLDPVCLAETMDWRGMGLEFCAATLIEYDNYNTNRSSLAANWERIKAAFSKVTIHQIHVNALDTILCELNNQYDQSNFFNIVNVESLFKRFEDKHLPEVTKDQAQLFKLHHSGLVSSEGDQNYHFIPLSTSRINELKELADCGLYEVFGTTCTTIWNDNKNSVFNKLRAKWVTTVKECQYQ